MHSLRRSLAVILALAGTSVLPAATPLVHLVGENTPLVISVRDFPSVLKQWDQSPWAKTWNDEQVKKYFAPFRAQLKVDEWDDLTKTETGLSLREIQDLITGDVLIAIPSIEGAFDEEKEDEIPILLAAEVGANASKLEKALLDVAKKEGGQPVETEDFAGATLYSRKAADADQVGMSWAVTDGVFLSSPVKSLLQTAVDALKKGGVANPLGQSDKLLELRKKTGNAHFTLLIDMKAIIPVAQQAVEAKAKTNPPQGMGFDPTTLIPALGLDALQEIYFAVSLTDAATEMDFGITYTEERGLIKLMSYREGPVPKAPYASARWVNATAAKYSFRDAYAALEEILENASPMLSGMAQGFIKQKNQELKIDFKRDLIGSLGEDLTVAYAARPGVSLDTPPPIADLDQLVVMSLTNEGAFTSALEALKGMAGPQADKIFQQREYLGTSIYTVTPPQVPGAAPTKGASYAIAKGYFFLSVGSAAPIESALQTLSGGQPTFWELPEVKQALADVPANASTFQFENMRFMTGSLMETFGQLGNVLAGPKAKKKPGRGKAQPADDAAADGAPGTVGFVDVTAKPDPARVGQYWSYATGYGYRDSKGLYGKSKIIHPK